MAPIKGRTAGPKEVGRWSQDLDIWSMGVGLKSRPCRPSRRCSRVCATDHYRQRVEGRAVDELARRRGKLNEEFHAEGDPGARE